MRVTAELFVSALMRRVSSSGGFAVVVRRGSSEAGAIFVVARGRAGGATLYGPAPQSSYDEVGNAERKFVPLLSGDDAVLDARLEKESRFDSDLWVVEIDQGDTPVDTVLAVSSG